MSAASRFLELSKVSTAASASERIAAASDSAACKYLRPRDSAPERTAFAFSSAASKVARACDVLSEMARDA